ncbi:L-ribulose-5-phosphate 4-epimerase AraD [Candidatus Pacearchaeota archaeon]|nr:L-ribulose-5-phosphate 4-epimerase AraD [Candidatus Pacearchaeota archaeon]
MFEDLKARVAEANKRIVKEGLVKLSFGNVSGLSDDGKYFAIKPSGVHYDSLTPDDMVVVNVEDGSVIEGKHKPSSDTPTHLYLYQNLKGIKGIVHTHSPFATSFCQAKMPLHCYGTTHADHFNGTVPVSRDLSTAEINLDYELNTGKAIAEAFGSVNHLEVPACLVAYHGPFVWGKSVDDAVENAIALEEVSKMAISMKNMLGGMPCSIPKPLLERHYNRKHGKGAYYGQGKK